VPLDVPESHRDLLEAPVAALATIGDDGFPQVTAVWFLYADGELKLSLNETRQKTKNLLSRPECTLLVLDTSNPARYLEIRARAQLILDESHALRDAVGHKYGVDLSAFDPPGQRRYAVTLEPVRVRAIDMSAG
jgi:PPOX class probable F420-dependent enzyme